MITQATARKIALQFDGTEEKPHFEKTSFRVKDKIFATYDVAKHNMAVKLTLIDQSVFCTFDKTSIYPIPNAWGKQGWTNIVLATISEELLIDILTTAYTTVATKKPNRPTKNKM